MTDGDFRARIEAVLGIPYEDGLLLAEEQQKLRAERIRGAGYCCEAGIVAAPEPCPWHPDADNPDPLPHLRRPR